ncbi:unnamed protein product [Fusarium fujikuroi]|uniref:Uncharacterized protein n=1 Tax=Fusarium fujikuroi TaxID=5127 RepID=A0A9Q9RGS4_FUSFU|nr:Uncharacterized protein Y057_10462 [Fusarium fujikuroi]VTT60774.1 unnamed protein product [Fusarium fujikuroi]VTT83652.1 unnamed protein product [Fusarium fujikuroi]
MGASSLVKRTIVAVKVKFLVVSARLAADGDPARRQMHTLKGLRCRAMGSDWLCAWHDATLCLILPRPVAPTLFLCLSNPCHCIQALCEPQEQKREPLTIAGCTVLSGTGTVIDRSHGFFESCHYTVLLESRIKVVGRRTMRLDGAENGAKTLQAHDTCSMLHATIEALSFVCLISRNVCLTTQRRHCDCDTVRMQAPSKMVALHNSTTKKCHAMPCQMPQVIRRWIR